jgi:hypothetical protein
MPKATAKKKPLLVLGGEKNSQAQAFAHISPEGFYTPGMTKAEFAAVHLISGHLQAHGKYPDKPQLIALVETAVFLFDSVIPAVIDDQDPGEAEGETDPE